MLIHSIDSTWVVLPIYRPYMHEFSQLQLKTVKNYLHFAAVRWFSKPGNLSLIQVERKDCLHGVVLQPPHMHHGWCPLLPTYNAHMQQQ